MQRIERGELDKREESKEESKEESRPSATVALFGPLPTLESETIPDRFRFTVDPIDDCIGPEEEEEKLPCLSNRDLFGDLPSLNSYSDPFDLSDSYPIPSYPVPDRFIHRAIEEDKDYKEYDADSDTSDFFVKETAKRRRKEPLALSSRPFSRAIPNKRTELPYYLNDSFSIVLSFLPTQDLLNANFVCTRMKDIIYHSDRLWVRPLQEFLGSSHVPRTFFELRTDTDIDPREYAQKSGARRRLFLSSEMRLLSTLQDELKRTSTPSDSLNYLYKIITMAFEAQHHVVLTRVIPVFIDTYKRNPELQLHSHARQYHCIINEVCTWNGYPWIKKNHLLREVLSRISDTDITAKHLVHIFYQGDLDTLYYFMEWLTQNRVIHNKMRESASLDQIWEDCVQNLIAQNKFDKKDYLIEKLMVLAQNGFICRKLPQELGLLTFKVIQNLLPIEFPSSPDWETYKANTLAVLKGAFKYKNITLVRELMCYGDEGLRTFAPAISNEELLNSIIALGNLKLVNKALKIGIIPTHTALVTAVKNIVHPDTSPFYPQEPETDLWAIIKQLHEYKVPINPIRGRTTSALHVAASPHPHAIEKAQAIIHSLCEQGADPSLDEKGQTPLEIALACNDERLALLLFSHPKHFRMSTFSFLVNQSSHHGHVTVFKKLLTYEAPLKALVSLSKPVPLFYSLLETALFQYHVNLLEELLSHQEIYTLSEDTLSSLFNRWEKERQRKDMAQIEYNYLNAHKCHALITKRMPFLRIQLPHLPTTVKAIKVEEKVAKKPVVPNLNFMFIIKKRLISEDKYEYLMGTPGGFVHYHWYTVDEIRDEDKKEFQLRITQFEETEPRIKNPPGFVRAKKIHTESVACFTDNKFLIDLACFLTPRDFAILASSCLSLHMFLLKEEKFWEKCMITTLGGPKPITFGEFIPMTRYLADSAPKEIKNKPDIDMLQERSLSAPSWADIAALEYPTIIKLENAIYRSTLAGETKETKAIALSSESTNETKKETPWYTLMCIAIDKRHNALIYKWLKWPNITLQDLTCEGSRNQGTLVKQLVKWNGREWPEREKILPILFQLPNCSPTREVLRINFFQGDFITCKAIMLWFKQQPTSLQSEWINQIHLNVWWTQIYAQTPRNNLAERVGRELICKKIALLSQYGFMCHEHKDEKKIEDPVTLAYPDSFACMTAGAFKQCVFSSENPYPLSKEDALRLLKKAIHVNNIGVVRVLLETFAMGSSILFSSSESSSLSSSSSCSSSYIPSLSSCVAAPADERKEGPFSLLSSLPPEIKAQETELLKEAVLTGNKDLVDIMLKRDLRPTHAVLVATVKAVVQRLVRNPIPIYETTVLDKLAIPMLTEIEMFNVASALKTRFTEIIELLLAYRTPINANKNETSVLHILASPDKVHAATAASLIHFFILNGARVDVEDECKRTPLFVAAGNASELPALALLTYAPTLSQKEIASLLEKAVGQGHINLFKSLVARYSQAATAAESKTTETLPVTLCLSLLKTALAAYQPCIVKELLKHINDSALSDDAASSLLFFAIREWETKNQFSVDFNKEHATECYMMMLERGAKPPILNYSLFKPALLPSYIISPTLAYGRKT